MPYPLEAMHARRYSVATLAGEIFFSIISMEHSAFDCSALEDDRQKTTRSSKASAKKTPTANPALKAAFERAERDNGAALVVPAPREPQLTGGAALELA